MSGAAGDEEMMAALGFTAFGRPPRYRHHARHDTRAEMSTLLQLMPGTELAWQNTEFATGSVEAGPHGVLYLLNDRGKDSEQSSIMTALQGSSQEESKEEEHVPYSALLKELEREKCKFDTMESTKFLTARAATNKFEKLGRHRFLNRSAMKLVTLDYVFQWTQTLCERQDAFTFADICGGPGGFSEYLLWRAGCLKTEGDSDGGRLVHGYGITLKGAANNCDWRVPEQSKDMFEACYGADGTGNLYSVANIHSFREMVRKQHPSGVDLAVADGGFFDARSQSNQESLMTRLILAEVLAMFGVLRVGGDFVCKTFEVATPPMLQLCWVLHQCFERFAVVKPITSRPASSERYIIARSLRKGYPLPELVEILENQLSASSSENSVFCFLPNGTPTDLDFSQYMTMANEAITRHQIQACSRINSFAVNKNKRKLSEMDAMIDPRQYYRCWELGDVPRRDPTR